MEFRNNAGNDLVIQSLCIFEWEILEAVSKILAPLAHNIVRGDLLCVWVVQRTSDNYVVCISVSVDRN